MIHLAINCESLEIFLVTNFMKTTSMKSIQILKLIETQYFS